MNPKPATIQASQITLKAVFPKDKDLALPLLQNKEIAKTYMMPDFKDEEAVVKLFEAFRRLSEDPDRFVYGIYFEDRLVGFLNETGKTEEDLELGYFIDPAYWNRGFATEALKGSIGALFLMGYSSVTAAFFEENIASKRVMEKCGMAPLGKEEFIEYRGVKHRCVYYRIHA